jgi:hypothetical protein
VSERDSRQPGQTARERETHKKLVGVECPCAGGCSRHSEREEAASMVMLYRMLRLTSSGGTLLTDFSIFFFSD